MRMRAKPPIITWAFVKWPYIAFSIPLNFRNRQEGKCGWVPTRIVRAGSRIRLFRIDQGKNSAVRGATDALDEGIKAGLSKQINIETWPLAAQCDTGVAVMWPLEAKRSYE